MAERSTAFAWLRKWMHGTRDVASLTAMIARLAEDGARALDSRERTRVHAAFKLTRNLEGIVDGVVWSPDPPRTFTWAELCVFGHLQVSPRLPDSGHANAMIYVPNARVLLWYEDETTEGGTLREATYMAR